MLDNVLLENNLFIHLSAHSFNQYLMSINYMPCTKIDARDTALNSTVSALEKLSFLWGRDKEINMSDGDMSYKEN